VRLCSRTLFIVFLAAHLQLSAAQSEAPPAPDSSQALKEGGRLHDTGDYEGALRVYEAALKNDPSNVMLLYERAYSTYAKGDAKKARALAEDLAPKAGRLAPAVQALLGNTYDSTGEPKKAIAAYEAGLEIAPDDPNLLYNLAVTRKSLGESARAREAVKRELSLRPDHPSGHLLLADSFREDGFRVPAILAYVRFLGLEPRTPRAKLASKRFLALLDLGVERKDAKNISITIDSNSRKEEGDYSSLEMGIAIMSTARFTEPDESLPDLQRRVKQVTTVLTVISEIFERPDAERKEEPNFVNVRYFPYVAEMKRKGFQEAFAYTALESSDVSGATEWLAANKAKVDEYLAWARDFGKRKRP
jgi:tetratricopeptide (TPR) repeat protein